MRSTAYLAAAQRYARTRRSAGRLLVRGRRAAAAGVQGPPPAPPGRGDLRRAVGAGGGRAAPAAGRAAVRGVARRAERRAGGRAEAQAPYGAGWPRIRTGRWLRQIRRGRLVRGRAAGLQAVALLHGVPLHVRGVPGGSVGQMTWPGAEPLLENSECAKYNVGGAA